MSEAAPTQTAVSNDVRVRIEAIEQGYEFFLAYAAQGLTSDRGAKTGGQLRDHLTRVEQALDGLAAALSALVADMGLEPAELWAELVGVIDRDASASRTAVRLVASRDHVGSQLIDNLNANIHLRALLTDLFLFDDLAGG